MLGFCEVRQAIVLDIVSASVLGCTGSVVLWQAAANLIPLWFSQWRTEAALEEVAERRIKLTVKGKIAPV
jgi:integral membrane sensor domain MASE1